MIIERIDRFRREYKKLPDDVEKFFKKQFSKFIEHPYDKFYPFLRIKRIQGTNNIFEMTIAMSIRVTWQYIDNAILFRNIGKYNKTLSNP